MTITAPGWFAGNFVDIFDVTALPINLTLATHKLALLGVAATPNFDTIGQSWTNANEVTGTGWVTGGIALSAAAVGATSTAPTVTISPAGTLMWDMGDVAVAGTTLTGARAAQIYADALTTPTADALIILIDFLTTYATVAGTFGVQWSALGVGTLDLTP